MSALPGTLQQSWTVMAQVSLGSGWTPFSTAWSAAYNPVSFSSDQRSMFKGVL